jgi:hypothetical protein
LVETLNTQKRTPLFIYFQHSWQYNELIHPSKENRLNTSSFIILSGVILIIGILIVILITRLNRNLWQRVQEMEVKGRGFTSGFRSGIETDAKIINKSEIITPNAGGYAKVNLDVEIQLPNKPAYQISTCWLVEVDSLDQVLPGKNIPIKIDPRKPSRIIPNIAWAKPWIFGK